MGKRGGTVFEKLEGDAERIGWAQGLLWAFDSLYVVVAEKNDAYAPGLYRLLDTNSDGVLDETRKLFEFSGSGEHGPHGLVEGPNGHSLYMVCGNGTPVPENIQRKRTTGTIGYDHLVAPGFGNTEYTEAGWVFRFDPDGSNAELIAGGLRNSYDIAFNEVGDLFTFDSDMEYDLGTPWYRPTRICQIVSGGEYGWRSNAGKWPEWYEDSVRPVVNVGPASPTGLVFGYQTAFPQRYRHALFALDWTYATLYAVHLEPSGGGYSGKVERFASGIGLPLTDIIAGADGALYFSVGGRRLGSAIYRIRFVGDSSLDTVAVSTAKSVESNPSWQLRKSLEDFHGHPDANAVSEVWASLGHSDWTIRYAARIALEWQPVSTWRERVFAESNVPVLLTAMTALARQGSERDFELILERVGQLDWNQLDEELLLRALRASEIALARGGVAVQATGEGALAGKRNLMPHASPRVNRGLARILCYLKSPLVMESLLDLMEADRGIPSVKGVELAGQNLRYASPLLSMAETPPMRDRMHYAQVLNWVDDGWTEDQHRRYFRLIEDALQTTRGGNGYSNYWNQILDTAKERLPESAKQSLSKEGSVLDSGEVPPIPEGPGRLWELDYLLDRLGDGFGERSFLNGERMFAAASCKHCHGMKGTGGVVGPDLTSIGQRFTINDILDSIIHPSKAISDQYQISIFSLSSGETVSGRVISKDARRMTIGTNALNPSLQRSIPNAEIVEVKRLPNSTMPPHLLNDLNESEVLDLIAYLVSGAESNHAIYQSK